MGAHHSTDEVPGEEVDILVSAEVRPGY